MLSSRDGHADHGTADATQPRRCGGPHEETSCAMGTPPLPHHRRVARPSTPRTLATTMRGSTMVYGVRHPPLGSGGPKMSVVVMVGQWPSVRARWGPPTSRWTRAVSYTCMASLARAAAGLAPWGRAHGLPIGSVWPSWVGYRGGGRCMVGLVPRGVESCPTAGFSLEGPSRRGASLSGQSMVRTGLSGVWGN